MDKPSNPFDELYEMVGEVSTFEEQVSRIKGLLEDDRLNQDLIAVLLSEALTVPALAAQNMQLNEVVKALMANIKEESKSEDSQERSNLLPFPKNAIIN